jgi:hypothetical protein
MHNKLIFRSGRVAALPLLVMAGVFAFPGPALGGRSDSSGGITTAEAAPALSSSLLATTTEATDTTATAFALASWKGVTLGKVDRDVFSLALESAAAAVARGDAEPSTLTIIDFSRPSTTRRMWVYDLNSRTLLFEEHVAHGRNSGHDLPTEFSNQPESNKSSLGLFRAAEGYVGKHGYSLRLDGLEPGINDQARARAIVIHGAEYVNGKTALAQGRLGRSLGCPAVRPEISRPLIDAIKEGGLVFAYYPDQDWLTTSVYLN